MRHEYRALGNDLYCDAGECTCLHPRWAGTGVAHLFKTKIKLTGYYDDNFFDNVHAKPREGACRCGRKFTYQWFRDGVEFSWEAA